MRAIVTTGSLAPGGRSSEPPIGRGAGAARRASGALALLALVCALCACGGQARTAVQSGPGWDAEFEQARAEYQGNDFVLKILEDNTITEEEMRAVEDANIRCLEDHGVVGAHYENGTLTVSGTSNDPNEYETGVRECAGISGEPFVQATYHAMKVNPTNARWADLYAPCLVRKGVVDPSFSGDDWERARQNAAESNRPIEEVIEYTSTEDAFVLAMRECSEDPNQ